MSPPLRTRKLANVAPGGRAGATDSIPCSVCFSCSGLTAGPPCGAELAASGAASA
jgi:hypothetical protein